MENLQKKNVKIKYVKFYCVFGFGYWKDVYQKELIGISGVAYNFIVPFCRIQIAFLNK
jgi:hypothetical protein